MVDAVPMKRIKLRVNAALAKGRDLMAVLDEIAPDYGLTGSQLYERFRRRGGRLAKQLVISGD